MVASGICRTRMYKCRERRMRRNGLLTPLTYVHAGETHLHLYIWRNARWFDGLQLWYDRHPGAGRDPFPPMSADFPGYRHSPV